MRKLWLLVSRVGLTLLTSRKRATVAAVILATAAAVALANAAFAAPPEEQNGPPGKKQVAPTGARNGGEQEGSTTEIIQTCDGKSIELTREEHRTLELHNKIREERGLKRLCVNQRLQKAARAHSKQMSETGYFSHTSRNGQTLEGRLKRSGYKGRVFGENIAWGSGADSSAESRIKAWMESPGHKRNMLDTRFEEVGVGVATSEPTKGANDGRRTFYTVDFGGN